MSVREPIAGSEQTKSGDLGSGLLETFGDNSPPISDSPGPGAPGVRFLDDFAAMRQVVGRRYKRVLEDGGPFPDLIVIDGGTG